LVRFADQYPLIDASIAGEARLAKSTLLVLLLLGLRPASADPAPGQFEVVDVSGLIAGEPQIDADDARASWKRACQDWKAETKDLNKKNEVLGINCNSPACSIVDAAKTQCSSTGSYKVKTAGVRVAQPLPAAPLPEPPVAAPLPPDHEIMTAPPEVVVEVVPAPRIGFVWVPGYWGWEGRRHVWLPGRWLAERPGHVWVRERWERRGRGWHFETGHWDARR
jgi:hypothetical protein